MWDEAHWPMSGSTTNRLVIFCDEKFDGLRVRTPGSSGLGIEVHHLGDGAVESSVPCGPEIAVGDDAVSVIVIDDTQATVLLEHDDQRLRHETSPVASGSSAWPCMMSRTWRSGLRACRRIEVPEIMAVKPRSRAGHASASPSAIARASRWWAPDRWGKPRAHGEAPTTMSASLRV